MPKKKTHNEYVVEVAIKNKNIEVVEKYISANTKITHRCLIDGYKWDATPANILSGFGCPKCSGRFRRTHNDYIEEVFKINPHIKVVGRFGGLQTPILHKCLVHNMEWMTRPEAVLDGCGCKLCGAEKIGDKNRKTHEQYVLELKEVDSNIVVLDTYIDAITPILHKCLIDKHEWYARPGNILFGYGCPKCHESSGERQIRQWLEKHDITYVFQKSFIDCRDIRMLPFDFYLPDYNSCIEYDDKQHFESIEYFGGQEAFELRVKHDNTKNEYCKNNGIPLLRIPYFKNVEEELNNFLFI